MQRLVEVVQRRARERAQRFVGRTLEVLVEGPSRTDPSRLRGRTRHNKVVNFAGLAQPGEYVDVEIDEATSQTLLGEQAACSCRRADAPPCSPTTCWRSCRARCRRRRRACSRWAPGAGSSPRRSWSGATTSWRSTRPRRARRWWRCALHELDAPQASFDAAVAVVSLHHVEPLDESCRRLAELVRPGGRLVVDEFDVERYDERAAGGGWSSGPRARTTTGKGRARWSPSYARTCTRWTRLFDALGPWFSLEPPVRGPYSTAGSCRPASAAARSS